jgi:hypothetical protein
MDYVVAGAIGALVGVVELASRHRDRPAALLGVVGAWCYVALNAAAAALALVLIRSFGLEFSSQYPQASGIIQVLVAGVGSLVVLRSSLLTVRVGDQDVAVGPHLVLASLLSIADRSVDRIRAKDRSQRVTRTMSGVSFEKSRVALPAFCLALLQNVSPAEQRELVTAIDALAGSHMTDTQKSYALGLLLMNVAGPDVVRSAVEGLGREILAAPPDIAAGTASVR